MSLPVDSLGLLGATRQLGDQMDTSAAAARDVDVGPPGDIDHVVVLGMGGSGMAGQIANAVAGPICPVPIVTVAGYEPPAFVGARTLVLAVSASGGTEEVVEATESSLAAGARLVGVTSGGRLGELLASAGVPVVPVDPSIPMPRAAVGAVSIPVLVVLERLGLAPGMSVMVDAAVGQVRRRLTALEADGTAASLARRIGRTLPIVYGGGEVGGVAARRWKTQCNENAKVAAFANQLPELTHNEICGWGQHGDVTRQIFTLVLLRHDHEHPQVARRFAIVEELVGEVVAGVHTVVADGDGPLAQLYDLMVHGDMVTLHMAGHESLDPGPVPVLDEIKARLAAPA